MKKRSTLFATTPFAATSFATTPFATTSFATMSFATASLLLVSALLFSLIQGCSTFTYYQQAIAGQYKVLSNRVDIESLIADPETPEELREKLITVRRVRAFSASEMSMDVGGSYSQYSDTKRNFVVWNISAAPELSLKPHQWCYPIIGCQSYRGYFQKQMAEEEAENLTRQGLDTWVGGVTAYSTLGWFDDPVLNTFVYREDSDLAALLIHELSHHVLYIKGDTAFNESFATAVELEGLRRWLTLNNQTERVRQHQQKMKERAVFISTVSTSIEKLKALYKSNISDKDKRSGKQQIIAQMKNQYQQAALDNELSGLYHRWFDHINNAKLITVSNYYQFVPAFTAMIAESKGNMAQFYKSAKALGEKDKESRDKILQAYLDSPAP
ncbi:aminopeptidase [Alkalimarinus coralli]|uniref:aminopeptidase n=1 Tax=Alkalimarinus coralli TaxID=2935863 RepID=UPI00202B3292|nr:aminopeptidase [Alkalimarinus coralli]